MNIFNTPISENSQSCHISDKTELERKIKRYKSKVKVTEWYYHFNRVFISPGNSFNVKYIIKVISYFIWFQLFFIILRCRIIDERNKYLNMSLHYSVITLHIPKFTKSLIKV